MCVCVCVWWLIKYRLGLMLNSSSFSCCCFKFSSSDRPFTIKIIRKLENLLIRLLRIEHTETESAVPTSKCYTITRKAFSKMSKKGLKKGANIIPRNDGIKKRMEDGHQMEIIHKRRQTERFNASEVFILNRL